MLGRQFCILCMHGTWFHRDFTEKGHFLPCISAVTGLLAYTRSEPSKAQITHMFRVKICTASLKAQDNWKATIQCMYTLKNPWDEIKFSANLKRKKTLPKQILESRKNNFSKQLFQNPKSTRTTNTERTTARFCINQFQYSEHNVNYGIHVISNIAFLNRFLKGNFQRELLIFLIEKSTYNKCWRV